MAPRIVALPNNPLSAAICADSRVRALRSALLTSAGNQQVDLLELDLYRKLVNTLRLSLEALGLRRRMRDIDIVPPPDRFFSPLRQQLAERAAAADAVIDDDDGEAIS